VLRLAQDFASEEVEEAGDHVLLTLGAGGAAHEREMAFVKRTHRRDEADPA